jgi:beta-glucosidase
MKNIFLALLSRNASIRALCRALMLFVLIALATAATSFSEQTGQISQSAQSTQADKRLEARVDSVLALMTLDEKIGQMVLYSSDYDVTGPSIRKSYADDIRAGKVGAVFNALSVSFTRKLQDAAMKETRLKIPLLFGYDVIHGYRTIFPVPLGETASWDTAAMRRSARIAATEAAAAGLHWTFAPMVDIARDPRWGRITEGAGEDTYLGSAAAMARVRGFQGDSLASADALLACAKHFAAYGAAQAGRDYHTTDMSDRTLREIYLPPFKACVDAGVLSFMTAFNELNGIPCTGNDYLLRQILRDEWKFRGFVVTDYTSINEMKNHGYGASDAGTSDAGASESADAEVGRLAANAGVDMDMQGAVFHLHLKKLVEQGNVPEKTVTEAARRVLRLKFMLGLFDNPYGRSDTLREQRTLFAAKHTEAALDVARKSIVLLKNDKRNESRSKNSVLPLAATTRTIALVGPLADSPNDMLGSWSGQGKGSECVSLLQGMRTAMPTTTILHAKGCNINDDSTKGFSAALDAARRADVVVAVLGEAAWMSGEAASRSSIGLPGVQEELLKELHKTGKPVVLVLMNGRPLAIPWAAANIPAIVEAWFLGTRAGDAVAQVLTGAYNPSGKLPVTFPRSLGQVPIFYNMKNTGRPMLESEKYTSKYLDVPNTPLYAFGHGLSYTTFAYENLRLSKSRMQAQETVEVAVDVVNTGSREGVETAQLYIRDRVASVPRPVKELRGFQKIALKAGERRTVRFVLTPDDLAFYNQAMKRVVEAGEFFIMAGGSSNNVLSTTLTITE